MTYINKSALDQLKLKNTLRINVLNFRNYATEKSNINNNNSDSKNAIKKFFISAFLDIFTSMNNKKNRQ
jgi:hypothetical protein